MRRTWHLATNAVVLAWLVAVAVVSAGHRAIPTSDWLMVHMLGLGALSTAIVIWSSHFAQTVRRRALPGGRRHEVLRLILLNAGALTVITGVMSETWPVTAVGGAAVFGAVAWHVGALTAMARSRQSLLGGTFGWMTWYYVASGVALLGGVAAGVTMANHDVGGDNAARAYVAHTVLMLLGWVGLTVIGTLTTLWPTMVRGQITAQARAMGQSALMGFVGGLVLVVAGAAAGVVPLVVTGLGLYVLALTFSLVPHALLLRARPALTYASLSVAAAALWLVGTVGWWAGNLATASSWPEAQVRSAGALMPLLVGVGAQVLLGALSHLVPVVLGGGPRGAAAAIAVVNKGADARLILINASLLVYVTWHVSWVRVMLSVVVLGALVASLVLVARAAVVARRVAAAAAGGGGTELRRGPDGVIAVPDAARPSRGGTASRVVAGLAVIAAIGAGVVLDPVAAGLHSRAPAVEVAPTGVVVEVDVVMDAMRFEPSVITVDPGDHLILTLINADSMAHDLVLATGQSSGRVGPGAQTVMDVGIVGSSVEGWCSVAGHRQMGMVMDIEVTGAVSGVGPDPDGEPGAGHGNGHSHGPAATGPSAAGDLDLRGDLSSDIEVADARVAPAPADTVHEHTLVVSEEVRTVAPGVQQTVWTYNGQLPGPTLRGKVGDTFVITLVNDGTLGHSIDFHAGALAPDGPMRTIEPGESLTYTFTADRAGIWMYHCSTHPMSLHIAAGMFGVVIIDPPDLPQVDHEFVVVQSEWYLGPQAELPDMARMTAGVPDMVTFNGVPFQYQHHPWEVGVGERIRVWLLNVGLERPSAFHVVGGQFDTVYVEGAYQLGSPAGPATDAGSQALGLLPSQGGFVELVLPEAGRYPFVTHLMVDAERGAAGTLWAVE